MSEQTKDLNQIRYEQFLYMLQRESRRLSDQKRELESQLVVNAMTIKHMLNLAEVCQVSEEDMPDELSWLLEEKKEEGESDLTEAFLELWPYVEKEYEVSKYNGREMVSVIEKLITALDADKLIEFEKFKNT